jgi:hypothetical protein
MKNLNLFKNIDEVLFFIEQLRKSDRYISEIYLFGSCYKFYEMIKSIAPDADAYMTSNEAHVVVFLYGEYFDITGIVHDDFIPMNEAMHEVAKKWSFYNQRILNQECPNCGETMI